MRTQIGDDRKPSTPTIRHPLLFRIAEKNICLFSFAALATKHGRRDTVNEVCASAATLELIELKAEKASVKVSEEIFKCFERLVRPAHVLQIFFDTPMKKPRQGSYCGANTLMPVPLRTM